VVGRDANGERRFLYEDYGASALYRLDRETVRWLAGARWLHFSRQRDLAENLAELRGIDTRISVDLGYGGGVDELEALGAHVDVVFLSASAAPDLTERQLVSRALSAGAPLVVVTLGATGSLAASGDRRWTTGAVPVEHVIDTLGAGDAYIAAFIAALTDGAQVDQAMRAGARAGAAACAQWGLTDTTSPATVMKEERR
jgi:fructoselysine 6-kinase